MVPRITASTYLVFILLLCTFSAFAQSPGDYRSAVNGGNWGTAATWESYNGTNWETAATQPASTNAVTIRNGFNVIIDASGKSCYTLTIENGATLTAGVALPTSGIRYIRVYGATAVIDGTFGNPTAPGDALSFENANNGGTVTITGSGTFAPARLRVNSNASNTTTVFNVDAHFMYTGTTGTGGVALYPQTDSNTFVVNAGRSLMFADQSNLSIGTSVGTAASYALTLLVHGEIDLSKPNCSATLKTSGGKTVKLSIGPAGAMTIGKDLFFSTLEDNGSSVVTDSGSLAVGGNVDMSHPAFAMTGPGTFTLQPGGSMIIGSAYGLDSANGPVRTQTRHLPEQATYTFKNTAAQQFTGMDLPDRVYALIINNANDTVALSKKTRVGNLTVSPGGAFRVIDTLFIDSTGNIGGTLANAGAITANDTLAFLNGSMYKHEINGGSIPTAAWDTNSTCLLAGLTNAAPENANQNFHHVVWNCPLQSSNLSLAWNGNVIRGDITILNTGTRRWNLCDPPAGTAESRSAAAVTMNGNIIQSGGEFSANSSSNGYTDVTVHTMGNVTVTGGNFSVSRGNQGGTGTTAWYLHGEVSLANATTQNANPDGASFIFANTGVTKLKVGAGNMMTAFPMRLQHGATLDLDTSAITGTGNLSIDSGATVITKHAKGLDGNIKSSGKLSLSRYANFEFHGAEAQMTGTVLPDSINDMVVNNAQGVILSKKQFLHGAVTLTEGKLSLGPNHLTADSVVGGSSSRFIATMDTGALKLMNVAGPSARLFPIGTDAYTPLLLKNEGTSDNFTVRVQNRIENTPRDSGKAVRCQWHITEEVVGGTQAQLALEWNGSDEAGSFDRNDTVVIGKFDGAKWTERLAVMSGSGPYRATLDSIESFSDWAIGNIGAFSDEGVTGVGGVHIVIPGEMTLNQNYPNPFNPSTRIRFTVEKEGRARVSIYNTLGQLVTRLFDDDAVPERYYDATFDGRMYSSGIYFYALESNGQRLIRRMVLIK
jgi:hypothetical protein